MKILLVDDDKRYCFDLKGHLEKDKNKFVSVAFDGDEANNCLKSNTYDVVFLDCSLPRICGVDLIELIESQNPQAKIIMVSGYDGIDKDFTERIGVDKFLRKPIIFAQIDQVLTEYAD